MSALLLAAAALAQDYRFPAADEDYAEFYPTAYKDHSGVDWGCGDITYDGHQGSDFGFGGFDGMEAGRTVVAAAAGVVTATNDGEYDACTTGDCDGGGGYGNYVWVQHPDGKATLYAHLKQWSVAVSVGQVVACGDALGEGGSSGHSTGPHLHFGVYTLEETYQDPFYGDCSGPPSWWVEQGEYDGLPGATCEDIAPCAPVGRLACGASVSGDSAEGGSVHAFYGCGEFLYSGPEQSWSFATDRDETVTLSLGGLAADLDLMLLPSAACDASACLDVSDEGDSSDESLSFEAEAGRVYTVVVDGWEGVSSAYTLSADCAGGWPAEGGDSAAPPESGGADSGAQADSQAGVDSADKLVADCACEAADPGGGLGLLSALGLLAGRRRRR